MSPWLQWPLTALGVLTAWLLLTGLALSVLCRWWLRRRAHRPPAPGTASLPPRPAPGHHRGDHMVIDTWRCGCIYSWTQRSGWVHDFDCLDEEIRGLLSDQH